MTSILKYPWIKCTKVILVSLFVLLVASMSEAKEAKSWSLLYGVGNNLTPSGTIRLGYHAWELGKLNHWAYGAAKNFFFSESYYTSFGFALMPTQTGTVFGFVAGLGAKWEIVWGLNIRLEIAANANTNANLYQQGILGVGYDF